MNQTEREQRSLTFSLAAIDYDAVRPGYPAAMYDDLLTYAQLPSSARIFEIGCGSGQATLPLARSGYQVTCIDPAPALVEIARVKVNGFSGVKILTSTYEDYNAKQQKFDLVLAATALHWIDPAVRYHKTASLLKEGAVFAVIRNTHPRPLSGFFRDTSPIYHRMVPEWRDRSQSGADPGGEIPDEFRQSGLFDHITTHYYEWSVSFNREQYLRLLRTFSDHLRLGEERLSRLSGAIGELIDSSYGGVIERSYLTELLLGRKRKI
ncbi:MAG: class I SAM-dependent methyltransferase [Candidatus Delongbacteria bacterium]|nr:class I SAM-dependent methyltransferase [Candidatus Delongbacteria bacterium]